ncbi:MAG: DUF1653 domain-containing protein [Lachnospiraceae bacterium]|nr:DUF1653 domain-containing protein [Lachnospiraceae bacterium]
MERTIHPGEFYRHFKDKLYQIIAVAVHSETGEQMVVYQALYGDFKVYVRPLAMFLSEVDHEKYPEAAQKYRFEQVAFQPEATAAGAAVTAVERVERQANPALLRFLEASGYDMQMECLKALGETAVQSDLDSVYVVLDMKPESGTIQEQTDAVGRFLSMQNHYDGNRLR